MLMRGQRYLSREGSIAQLVMVLAGVINVSIADISPSFMTARSFY
jgi:putative effector of murein hydrolase